jgi:polysaccharide biosynthesis protein PslG
VNRRASLLAAAIGVAVVLIAIAVVMSAGSSSPPATTTQTSTARPAGSGTATSSQTSTAAVAPPGQPAPAGEQFGASVNYLFNGSDFTAAQVMAQLQALRRTGATVARSDAFWEASEPGPPVNGVHHYQGTFDDRVAGTLAAHGLRWLPIIDYTAPWAQSIPGQDHSPPSSDASYAQYAGAFAARYGQGGVFWRVHPGLTPEPVQTYEIWNEPDSAEFWTPRPDPGRYAQLYEQARDAILAADPNARVLVGGLKSPSTFLPAMVAAQPQLRGHIDGVAIHPYGDPLVVLSKIRAARAAIAALGLGPVPLYVTEFGWTTGPKGAVDYAPERRRPRYLLATLSALGHLNCGLAAAVLYTWVSPRRDPNDSQDWYGISSLSGGATPSVAAFQAGLSAAAAPRAPIRLCAA